MGHYVRSAGLSDIGLGRKRNEDAWIKLDSLSFYALADGMGGHPSGDIAANQLLHHLCRLARMHLPHFKGDADELQELMQSFICQGNDYLYQLGREEPELKGMGSTLLMLCFCSSYVVFGHVGDSRIYRWRPKEGLVQLTEDHSLLRELASSGILPDRKIERRVRNVLTRAVGTRSKVRPEIGVELARDGDVFLLSSDGLFDVVGDAEIAEILQRAESVDAATYHLVEAARSRGGRDNITTLIVQVEESDESHLSRQQCNDADRPSCTAGADRDT